MKSPDFDFLQATLPATDLVYNLSRRCTASREEAEDLVQETYLRALKAWRDHRRPDKVGPWMATICLNLVRSDYRRKSRRPSEQLVAQPGLLEPGGDNTEERALASLEKDLVHRMLWELPEEQRIAVALVDLCGLTAAEAAQVTGSPRGTVLSRVHRGRKALGSLPAARKVRDLEP